MQEIFVFGSNLAGIHGAGAARYAVLNHGAIYGRGIGIQGTSYALPTKDQYIETLPIEEIKKYADQFVEFAKDNPDCRFYLTKVGCGLAGYTPEDIAPLFVEAPSNVRMDEEFITIIKELK